MEFKCKCFSPANQIVQNKLNDVELELLINKRPYFSGPGPFFLFFFFA